MPGVNAGVRPAAARDFDRLLQRAGKERFQLSLHRLGGVSLLLPAAVARAVVGKRQFIILHRAVPLFHRASITHLNLL